uniref:Uncharacterized protein n=2 Tax=Canis lupus familiaris TaxID=9615 RepID=A0A8C0YSN3_CANLF
MNSTLVKITEIEANQDGSDSKEQGHSTPPGLLKACLANLHRELIIPKGGGGGGPGEDPGLSETSEDLHQTQRPVARLYISSGAALFQDYSGGFLQEDSQKSYQRI